MCLSSEFHQAAEFKKSNLKSVISQRSFFF